uniref:NADH dehydrogenase [ubiquinone] 1 alpha subcomplex subunit 8 n=1 Tax=Schistocephalus solidus TaxID=70667 RepID=A0A0X3NPP3_SCHSO
MTHSEERTVLSGVTTTETNRTETSIPVGVIWCFSCDGVGFLASSVFVGLLKHSMDLPPLSELEVPEIKMTSVPLLAAAIHMGKFCDRQSKEFMLCNQEHHDPRRCLTEGKEVTSCGLKFLGLLKKNCADQFTDYFKCIYKHGGRTFSIENCRKLQYPLDECIKMKIGQERPELGYFNRVRLIDTNRPRPTPKPAPMPERIPDMPDFDSMPDPETLEARKYLNEAMV